MRLACQEDGAPPGVETLTKLSTALSGVWYQVTCTARLTHVSLTRTFAKAEGITCTFNTPSCASARRLDGVMPGSRAMQGSSYTKQGGLIC